MLGVGAPQTVWGQVLARPRPSRYLERETSTILRTSIAKAIAAVITATTRIALSWSIYLTSFAAHCRQACAAAPLWQRRGGPCKQAAVQIIDNRAVLQEIASGG